MKKIGSMGIAFREEYTETALKRTTPINNSSPDGFLKVITAIARLSKGKKLVKATSLTAETDKSDKAVKDVGRILGSLSRDPFPIVRCEKHDKDGRSTTTSLYDMATGNVVAPRYASVNLSSLGYMLMRHGLDRDIDSTERFQSIVPYEYLKFYQPFATGHKSNAIPLNPEELFRLQVKMIEYGTWKLPDKVVNEIFRGFDVGNDYTVLMTNKSLITLYTQGYGSLIAIPDFEIDIPGKMIIFKVPPLRKNSETLKEKLHLLNKSSDVFKSFTFKNDIKILGRGIKISVKEWRSTDPEVIRQELTNSPHIYVKFNSKYETIKYKPKTTNSTNPTNSTNSTNPTNSTTPTNPTTAPEADYIDINEVSDEHIAEELKIIEQEDLIEKVAVDPTGSDSIISTTTTTTSLTNSPTNQANVVETDVVEVLNWDDLKIDQTTHSTNPYNFTLEISPVYQGLWECIQMEYNQKILEIKKLIEELQERLYLEMLIEKITRPIVRDVISDLNKRAHSKHQDLFNYYKDHNKSELPEGFTKEEVKLIYSHRPVEGYSLLAILYHREEYKDLMTRTQDEINKLKARMNQPKLIMEEIKDELNSLIDSGEFRRKSKVLFKIEKNLSETPTMKSMGYNSEWESMELPCSIYYDFNLFRKSYGVNLYFNDFQPQFALNCTNSDSFQYLYMNNLNQNTFKVYNVKDIPAMSTIKLEGIFKGIIPIVGPNQRVIFYTNLNNCGVYENLVAHPLPLQPNEFIVGWEYMDDGKDYLDIRTASGITKIPKSDFKRFEKIRKSLQPLPATLSQTTDMLSTASATNHFFSVWRDYNSDHNPINKKFPKSIDANVAEITPELYSPFFSQHLERYVNQVYIPDERYFAGVSTHKNQIVKPVILPEHAFISQRDPLSKKIKNNIFDALQLVGNNDRPLSDIRLITRSTRKFVEYSTTALPHLLTLPAAKNIVDPRLLTDKPK